ncbi:hypothetical protein HNY73_017424 [Argiope bruennichi]|uniref:Uncharacterized protein n=1 Tax=Argiope bruennichi TaxID=94029 RepID=A0A8T0ECL5_ARGBR|nr:hypothetical protein HNY73_017424 [Argiope bruennichi]
MRAPCRSETNGGRRFHVVVSNLPALNESELGDDQRKTGSDDACVLETPTLALSTTRSFQNEEEEGFCMGSPIIKKNHKKKKKIIADAGVRITHFNDQKYLI